jgi:hypothetical protein
MPPTSTALPGTLTGIASADQRAADGRLVGDGARVCVETAAQREAETLFSPAARHGTMARRPGSERPRGIATVAQCFVLENYGG